MPRQDSNGSWRDVTLGEIVDALAEALRERPVAAPVVDPQLKDLPALLRAGEVAKLLGIGRTKVFAMASAGEMPVVRLGRSLRIPRDDLMKWLAEQTEPAAAPHANGSNW